jgi:hypothetical protein
MLRQKIEPGKRDRSDLIGFLFGQRADNLGRRSLTEPGGAMPSGSIAD